MKKICNDSLLLSFPFPSFLPSFLADAKRITHPAQGEEGESSPSSQSSALLACSPPPLFHPVLNGGRGGGGGEDDGVVRSPSSFPRSASAPRSIHPSSSSSSSSHAEADSFPPSPLLDSVSAKKEEGEPRILFYSSFLSFLRNPPWISAETKWSEEEEEDGFRIHAPPLSPRPRRRRRRRRGQRANAIDRAPPRLLPPSSLPPPSG